MTQPANTFSASEFWDNMVKGSAPIQMMRKGLGDELWREKEKLALEETLPMLKRQLTSDAWLGGEDDCKKSRSHYLNNILDCPQVDLGIFA
ncbi:MAG: hypothetical protein WC742_11375 [Gallionellaceae bacterium]